jgi:MerR family redox-sensitive transcriptional activator SoxR
MAQMMIGEVAQQVGVRASTLRYYERIGLLPVPARVSGRRQYDASIVQRLEIIKTAQQAGFSLDETRLLLDDILPGTASSAQWHDLFQRKLEELNTLLGNVQSMKLLLEDIMACDDEQLEECIYQTGLSRKTLGR